MCFISEHEKDLEKVELLLHCHNSVVKCFEEWTSRFEVEHYDKAGCNAKGRRLDYYDCVRNADAVWDLPNDLREHLFLMDWADSLIISLAKLGQSDINSAWFLEYARAACKFFDYFDTEDSQRISIGMLNDPAKLREELYRDWWYPKSEPWPLLPRLVINKEILRAHFEFVDKSSLVQKIRQASPTYWDDIQMSLHLV